MYTKKKNLREGFEPPSGGSEPPVITATLTEDNVAIRRSDGVFIPTKSSCEPPCCQHARLERSTFTNSDHSDPLTHHLLALPRLPMIGAQTAVGAVLLFLRTLRHRTRPTLSPSPPHSPLRPAPEARATGRSGVISQPATPLPSFLVSCARSLARSLLAAPLPADSPPRSLRAPAVCVFLFVAGIRTDDDQYRKQSSTAFPDLIPIRRSLVALQYENQLLRVRVNETARENEALHARMRAALRSDLASTTAPTTTTASSTTAPSTTTSPSTTAPSTTTSPSTVASASPASAAEGVVTIAPRPRALAERVQASTEFTRERARAVASDGRLILSFVNRVRLDFADSFVVHLRRLGLKNWLIGATDRTALRELRRKGVPCFDMSTNLPEGQLRASRRCAVSRAPSRAHTPSPPRAQASGRGAPRRSRLSVRTRSSSSTRRSGGTSRC